MFTREDQTWAHRWMRGQASAEEVAAFVGSSIGVPSDEVLVGLRYSCEQMTLARPEILTDIADLRRAGIQAVIATDNMDTFMRWTVPAQKLTNHVDAILSSAELGMMKRDKPIGNPKSFYGRFLRDHQLDPRDCLLVDDSAATIAFADAGGMQTLHVTNPTALNLETATLQSVRS
ncbi:HAD hydrolase-like protein [Candidatus Berkelbacteria bacterium]|nr:HAD hydrolase-like protein [Candidatus Berkelbacteria bacterium]